MSDPCSWEFWTNFLEFWVKDSESFRNLSFTVGAFSAVILGIVRTWAANRSSWAADQQAKTGVQSHITENFTKAIEQLGSDKLDVRLGAIYALARIAQDSERDYWPIMQTLTAYVREKQPRLPDNQSSETDPPKLPVDIQSVIAVLGSRKHEFEKLHQTPDLGDTDLRGLNLT